ncbi:MAG TPA: hypothetical protein VNH18_31955 [Bryobacteraceae bacterium]|nr:hypothetical protein [Bryobacteraceae bacterium]
MSQSGPNKKVANSLVAVSSAAVLAVYSAGYFRTRWAADRFASQTAERRPPSATPGSSVMPIADIRPLVRGIPAVVTPTAPAAAPSVSKVAASGSAVPSAPPTPAAAITSSTDPAPTPVPVEISSTPAPDPPVAVAAPSAPALTAVQPTTPPPAPPAPPKTVWKDGTYTGWGTSRHGDIQARVIIEGGRIASATIAQCLTRYSCDVIDKLPPQVAQRQSPETDFVSGATQSTNAFYYGVVEALSKAK